MGHPIDYSFPKKVTQVPNIFTSCTINLGDREAILSILKANTKDKNIMEKTTKAMLVFTLFLMAFLKLIQISKKWQKAKTCMGTFLMLLILELAAYLHDQMELACF